MKFLSAAIIAIGITTSLPASAIDLRCQHIIDLPNSCSAQSVQFTNRIVTMGGWAETGCLLTDGRKVSWTLALYAYNPGEPILVSRPGTNSTSYPTYAWACPSPAMTREKHLEFQKRKQAG